VAAQKANKDLLEETTRRIKAERIADGKIEKYAEAGGLSDLYYSAYTLLSQHVHVNVDTLEDTLDLDAAGNLVSMKYGFSDENLDVHLLLAAEALIITLRATFSVIDVSTADEIHAIHDEFNALYDEIAKDD
jgi:hypothetical protein